MPAEVNIRQLFAQLRLGHLVAYLTDKGWADAPDPRDDRVRFELADSNTDDDDAPFILMLPRTDKTPDCRTLLQRAVYNLSCVEDRQPAEILQDMLTTRIVPAGEQPLARRDRPAHGAAPAAPPVRLRLRNLDTAPLAVQVASRSGETTLLPGEAIELVCHPSADGAFEIGFQGGRVRVVE